MAHNLTLHPYGSLSIHICCSCSLLDLFNQLLALFDANRASELLVWCKSMGGLEYENVMDVNWNGIFRFRELVS